MRRRRFLKQAIAWGAALVASYLPRQVGAAAAVLFADSFTRRSSSKGWGKPWFNQRRGLRWGITKNKGFFELPTPQIGAGRHNPNPVIVLDRDVTDVDVKARFVSSNKNSRFGLVGRVAGYGNYYAAYFENDKLTVSKLGMAREKELRKAAFRVAAGKSYWLRLRVSGTDPVRIEAKAWPVGRREPSSFTARVSEPTTEHPIVRRGSFGCVFMHDDLTKKPARIKVDSFTATSVQRRRNTIPEITFAFAGRLQRTGGALRARVVAKTDIPARVVFHVGNDPKLNNFSTIAPDLVDRKALVSKAFLADLADSGTVYWRAQATTPAGRKFTGRVRALPTAPRGGEEVRFCFGSCSKSFATSRAFDRAAALSPMFFAHLGDFGYPESIISGGAALALTTSSFQDRWTRMLGRPSMTRLHRSAAWIMLQDDHDYGRDNAWRDTVRPFTVGAFDALSGNLNERHFDVRYGDLHCFFVDTRRNADDPAAPDGPNHSLLGATQKTWLKQAMSASDALLLVLFASLPFWGGGDGLFSWKKAFATEREELMAFFKSLQGPNRRVIVCSGNAHAHHLNRHPEPGGKDVIEFVSSGMDRREITGVRPLPDDGIIDPQRNVKSRDGFGFVRLKAVGNNPRVELRCIDSSTGTDLWPSLTLDI